MGPRKIRPLVVLLKVKSIKRRRLSCCPSSNNKVEAMTTRHTAEEKRHFLGKLFLFMTFLYAFYECISYPVSSCEYIRPFCVLVWADTVLCCFGLLCNVFVLILSLFRVFSHVKLFVHSEALLLKESADIFPFPCLLRLPCQCKIWGRTFCFHSRSLSCSFFFFQVCCCGGLFSKNFCPAKDEMFVISDPKHKSHLLTLFATIRNVPWHAKQSSEMCLSLYRRASRNFLSVYIRWCKKAVQCQRPWLLYFDVLLTLRATAPLFRCKVSCRLRTPAQL